MPAPTIYECSVCHKKGVKLWRQYQTFAVNLELMCRDCAEINQKWKKDPSMPPCDQIAWMVPAIPDDFPVEPDWKIHKNASWWGYTSVPDEGIKWWYNLPGISKK